MQERNMSNISTKSLPAESSKAAALAVSKAALPHGRCHRVSEGRAGPTGTISNPGFYLQIYQNIE